MERTDPVYLCERCRVDYVPAGPGDTACTICEAPSVQTFLPAKMTTVETALDKMEAETRRLLDKDDAPMVRKADLDALARVRHLWGMT